MQRFGTHTPHTRVYYVLANVTAREIRMRGLDHIEKGRGAIWLSTDSYISVAEGHKKMSSILADQYCPCIWAQMRGEGVLRGLSQWVQLCTWSPNKLWRSKSIFNLWSIVLLGRGWRGYRNSCGGWEVYRVKRSGHETPPPSASCAENTIMTENVRMKVGISSLQDALSCLRFDTESGERRAAGNSWQGNGLINRSNHAGKQQNRIL